MHKIYHSQSTTTVKHHTIGIIGDRPFAEIERSAINATSVRFPGGRSKGSVLSTQLNLIMEQEITERIKRLALPKLPPINLAAEQYLVRGRKLQELEDICRDIQENLVST